ncbi:MAG: cytochrome P450 [Candidatus Thiodiazotropha sp. 'RUGA']|nr:cytochrome P450 [Candidatus Thiodiazotropha sp. 'RUGA']
MSKLTILDNLSWRGSDKIYSLPWLRNRIEFSADPNRVKEFAKESAFTRSQLTIDLLTRFHLSNNSIVVSHDEHAHFLRERFSRCLPKKEAYPEISQELIDRLFCSMNDGSTNEEHHLSSELIREVYISLLENMLGANLSTELIQHIKDTKFKPGSRPVHLEGLMFAFSLQLPGVSLMRNIVDFVYFRGEHYTRKIAKELEKLVDKHATPKDGSWLSVLLELKEEGKITHPQYRGELTSMLVSSFSLSSALCSMLLCIAVLEEYVIKIRENEKMARCFVSEVLRLYSPFRRFGYEKKGTWEKRNKSATTATDFMVSLSDLHRNEKAWKDPEKFYPERFLTPGIAGGYKYLPFGMGNRSCIGRSYSIQMMINTLKYICSESFAWKLRLPKEYNGNHEGLPIPISGRLVSFPVDDRINICSL